MIVSGVPTFKLAASIDARVDFALLFPYRTLHRWLTQTHIREYRRRYLNRREKDEVL
jgi:hypothetical protein